MAHLMRLSLLILCLVSQSVAIPGSVTSQYFRGSTAAPAEPLAFANLGASAAPDVNNDADATSYASASWTPPATGLLVVFVHARGLDANGSDPVTVTGNNVTWTQIGATVACAANSMAALLAADASASTTGATTFNFGAETETNLTVSFFHVTGADVSGGVAAAFVQRPTNSGTGTSGSVTLSSAAATTNRPIAFFWHDTNEAKTPRANWTELDDLTGAARNRNIETQYRGDAFETTASATWITSTIWCGIAAEIKD